MFTFTGAGNICSPDGFVSETRRVWNIQEFNKYVIIIRKRDGEECNVS